LEEYYFKPSAIVSYSPGGFGGINAAQQMRLISRPLLYNAEASDDGNGAAVDVILVPPPTPSADVILPPF
jgi:NAD(P)H-dependent FMN reductase